MYEVTVTVSDGVARNSQAVLVTVTNKEEDGKITLTQRRPQEGIAITANLSDPDGNITDTKWQWYRGNVPIGIFTTETADASTAEQMVTLRVNDNGTPDNADDDGGDNSAINATDSEVTDCTLETGTASITCAINDATSSTYIPVAADDGKKLHARASYVDGYATDKLRNEEIDETGVFAKDGKDDGDIASATSEQAAVKRPNANAAPKFVEKGPVSRSVAENVKNAGVGDPVAASDSDPLIYTLSGDDAGSFKVDNSGQIQTKKKLDYETKSSYTVTLTATDPSLSSASITVNITVTDADDPATISGLVEVEYAENGKEPVRSLLCDRPGRRRHRLVVERSGRSEVRDP